VKLVKIMWARLVGNGSPGTTKLKAKRGGVVARWLMWSPTRFMVVASVLIAVLLGSGLAYAGTLIYKVQVAKYEADMEAYNQQVASEQKAAEETGGVDPLDGTDPLNGTTADPAAAPSPTATGTTTSAPAPASDTKAPTDVAAKFLGAWSGAAKAKSNAAWIQSMQPYAAPAMLDSFRLTDHTAMPTDLKVTGLEVFVTDTSAVALAEAGAFGKIKLALDQQGGKWLVSELVPADGH